MVTTSQISGEARATKPIRGIHHVTAISGHPQPVLDFYAGVLGLRLVKKTVNFDDPGTYHLYFGDGDGAPGSILTFFPWPGARSGRRGTGQATATSFAVSASSLGYWVDRLKAHGVTAEAPKERLGEEVLTFLDPDGLELELVGQEGAEALGAFEGGPVAAEHALRGFSSVTLMVADAAPTAALLQSTLGFVEQTAVGDRVRYRAPGGGPANRVDVVEASGMERGHVAGGTVHHVAFRVADEADELAWRARIEAAGHHITPVQDRQYFRSVYFREPGGVLFELATDPPGFAADEAPDRLGTELKLPPWLEGDRERIERRLPELRDSSRWQATGAGADAGEEVGHAG